MIFLTECDGWAGPNIEAKCWEDAGFILWIYIVTNQVPPNTVIIGELTGEIIVDIRPPDYLLDYDWPDLLNRLGI